MNIITDAFYSLGKNVNKRKGDMNENENAQGVISQKFPELTLEMDNSKLADLTTAWEKKWTQSEVYSKWIKDADENEKYWLGKHFDKPEVEKTRAQVDNAIFESLETYLPQVTRRNPEPSVKLDESLEGDVAAQEFAQKLTKKLGDIADELKLRLKLKKAARHWAIFLLGAVKYGWDVEKDIPTMKVVRAKKLILDPDATVDEDGYTGEYVGEHRKLQASILIKMLEGNDAEEEAVNIIKELVKDDLGTEVGFIEWWTNEYMCWTIDKKVLLKKKNIHWNYDTQNEIEAPADEVTGEAPIDPETGMPMMQIEEVPGINFFKGPRKPYDFLSVFNLGLKPVDDTSLIGQNLANQDLMNKRIKQIDKNADSMNGGMVVSGERSGLTQQQAKGVTEALRKGGTVFIPAGAVSDAVMRQSAPPLPPDIYNQLVDVRNRVKDIFGTRGSSASGLESDTTVRGKFLNRTLDSDRIGGGFSEYLEQLADSAYNWFVQLMYVYDEEFADGQPKPEFTISVKEGSLLPKDSITIANQAIELANSGKMSTLDLYKRLDYPNPEELAANVWLEANAPHVLFADDPRVQQVLEQQAASNQPPAEEPKGPSESISYKDLPPDGKAQMAAKVGIQLDPAIIAAEQAAKEQPRMGSNIPGQPGEPNPLVQ